MVQIDLLRNAELFFEMSDSQLEQIAAQCIELTLDVGAVIFQENDSGDAMYVIVDGEVEIRLNPQLIGGTGDPQTIGTFRRGQSFGEMALIDEGNRSASAHCVSTTKLITLKRDAVFKLAETDPKLGYRLMYNMAVDLATKIRSTDIQIREQILYATNKG